MDAIAPRPESGRGRCSVASGTGRRSPARYWIPPSANSRSGFIRGPAPLGPGAPASERLIAFGRALLEHIAAHVDLLLAAETAGRSRAPIAAGPYGAYRTHLMMLIREANPALDAEYTAEALLAPLGAEIVTYQVPPAA